MADVVLSYARDNREQAESLAHALEVDYRFDVPTSARRAVLRIIHDDQTVEIPLDLTVTGR
jgi:hypothetical protein